MKEVIDDGYTRLWRTLLMLLAIVFAFYIRYMFTEREIN